MSSTESVYNPRLTHAVWFCTRTSGSPLDGQYLQTLQEFLLDSSTADATYMTIIGRARAEPLSVAVWVKCVELLKRYLPRFEASTSTLQEIRAFCSDCMASMEDLQPGLLSSLQFLQALVAQQAGESSPARTLFRQADDSQAGLDILPAGHGSPVSRQELSTPPRGPASEHVNSASQSRATESRYQSQETDLIPDMLTFAWLPEAAQEYHSLESCAAFVLSLAVVSKRGAFSKGLADSISPDNLAGETLKLQKQLNTIAALHQMRGRHAAYLPNRRSPEASARKRQHRVSASNSEAAALLLDENDIEAILESVCGPSALPSTAAGGASANGESSSGHTEAPEMCCSLLSHLLLDLWQRAGPGNSFTLALVLLRRLLRADRRATQLRAFDVLYNMSLNCEILSPGSKDNTSPSVQGPDVELVAVFSDESFDNAHSPLQTRNEQTKQIKTWLRMLLFELLLFLAQNKATSEELWQAAVGCLCHLCSSGGDLKREWLQPMPPRAMAAILRCSSQHHWPDSLHTQLVRLTTNLLYVEDDSPAADRKGSSQQPEGGLENADSIPDSNSDGGLSFKTAATDSEPAAAQPCSHAGLRLSLARLQAFGGVEEVARHFRAAASREARRNLLCILLDCIVARLCKGLHEEANDISQLLEGPEDALLICRMMAASDVADALSAAFLCGLPGFALPIASSLSLPASMQESEAERMQAAIRLVLEQAEALAVSTAAGELTPALLPALTHTLAGVSSAAAASQGANGVWACLTDLFCSPDPRSAQLAESWLLRLLVAAAERHLQEHEEAVAPALLPVPPGTGSDSIGLQQEQLADVLQHILDKATPRVNTVARLVRVVWRLLLVVKQRCSLTHSVSMELTSPPISPPFLRSLRGAARSICTPRPSTGKEGSGHHRVPSLDAALRRLRLSDETYYSASASASADQEVLSIPPLPASERQASRFSLDPAASNGAASDDTAATASPADKEDEEESEPGDEAGEAGVEKPSPRPEGASMDLAARGDMARQEQKSEGDAPDGASAAEPGAEVHGGGASARKVLVTEEEEQGGEEEASVWHSYSAAELSLPTQAVLVDWLLDAPDICREEAFLELGRLLIISLVLPAQVSFSQAKSFSLDAAADLDPHADVISEQNAVGTVAAFLAGTLGVPHDLLSSVSPVMLAHIFQNMPQSSPKEAWSSTTLRDVRAAVLLLLAARCKGSLEDTAAIGGSSFFVGVLNDRDPRVRHIAASFLQAHFMASQPRAYRRGLRQLVIQAQQNAEDRLCNAFLQVSSLLDMRLVDPAA